MTEYGDGATSSQLTFLDTDDHDLILGADTQATDFDFRDFTIPSQSQTQASQSDHLAGSSQVIVSLQSIMMTMWFILFEKVIVRITTFTRFITSQNFIYLQINGIAKGRKVLPINSMAELQFEEEDDESVLPAQELPQHACKYCGIHEPSTVVMCNICKKWYV